MNRIAPSQNRLLILAICLLGVFLLMPSVSAYKENPISVASSIEDSAAPEPLQRLESAVSPDNPAFQEKTRENTLLPSQRYSIAINPQEIETRLQPLTARELNAAEASVPLQIGRGRDVEISSGRDGAIYTNRDGTKLRVMAITSPDAVKLRVRFEQFDLPAGDEVYVYGSSATSHVAGPYTGKGPWENGSFWSDTVEGETVIIEHYTKGGERSFRITRLSHLYKEISVYTPPNLIEPQALSCHNDANCFNDGEKNAVGRITFTADTGRSFLCTGTLLNSASQAPFFLTAAHCVGSSSEAQTVEVRWFYRSTSCNSGVLDTNAIRTTFGGAAFLASSSSNDSTLIRLLGSLPGGLSLAGWTAGAQTTNTNVFSLSHPRGEYLRRASGRISSTSRSCGGGEGVINGYEITWSSGLTEGGSSGSGIWATISGQNYLVGVLSCGPEAACTITNTDVYGKFSNFYPMIQTFLQSGSSCTYNINPTSQSFSANGGSSSVSITTSSSSCAWTVSNVPSWVSITSGAGGTGNGTVGYTVFQNTSTSSRSATLTIANQSFTISQAAPTSSCTYQLSSSGQDFGAGGGTSSVSVTTASNCTWSVSNVPIWITINFGSSGSGAGTVNYTVAANTTTTTRSATLTIAGQAFSVTQSPSSGGGTITEIAIDDGSFENSFGLTNGGDSYRVNRLTPTRYPATLSEVAIYFRNSGGVTVGTSFTVVVGTNPDGDANINNTSLQTLSASIRGLDQFNVYDVPDITINSGDFVVGMRLNHAAGTFPFALDQTSPQRRSYRSLDGVTFSLQDDVSPSLSGNYGIRARVSQSGGGGGGTNFVSLTSGIAQTGSIGSIANACALSTTQYMIQAPNGSRQLRIDLVGNQDVDFYVRLGQAVSLANGTVAADYRADSQASSESLVITSSSSPPLQSGTYFIAVSNCGAATANFTLTATVSATLTPRISGATVQGKKLIVIGGNFSEGATLFMNGARQKKTTNSEDTPTTTLIAAKSGKSVARGSTVILQVQNPDGTRSNEYFFTRP